MVQKLGMQNLTGESLTVGNTVITGTGVTVSGEPLSGGTGGAQVYANSSVFPLTDLTAGSFAFANNNNTLFMSNGSGWYKIALINQTPTITASLSSVSLGNDANTVFVGYTVAEPEGTPVTVSVSNSGISNTSQGNVVHYTSNNTIEVNNFAGEGGEWSANVILTVSDGVNLGTDSFTIGVVYTKFFAPQDLSPATLINSGGNLLFSTAGNPRGFGVDYNNSIYAVDYNNSTLYKKDISNIISEETASPSGGVNASTSVAIPGTKTNNWYMGCCVSSNGRYVFIADTATSSGLIIKRYELTTPYDISTIQSPSADQFQTTSNDGWVYYLSISEDGTILYASCSQGSILKITMTAAYDLSTASISQTTPTNSSETRAIDPTGSRILNVFYYDNNFSTTALSTPHDLSTLGSASATISYPNSQPICAVYTADGNYVIIGDQQANKFYVYKLI